MQPLLEPAANDQKHERNDEGDQNNPPLPDTAGDANASREPGTGRAGEPADAIAMLSADNDASAEKTDAGEDTLNDPARRV